MERWRVVDRLAARAVAAADRIDAIRGGDKAWRWYFKQVERLRAEGRQNDPDAIRPVVEALEEQVERERERRREETSP